ncbi:MAG TPA: hypothetical protein VGJ26_09025 [Pirellulales bacterium]|jgi:hypothetical protein
MTISPALEDLLGAVFDDARDQRLPESEEPADYAMWKQDFIFHMTDWMEDMEKLRQLFANPRVHNTEDASRFVVGFLYHVIPHVETAGRLLLNDIPNPFPHPPVRPVQ